jgi:hypothetical protein
VPGELYLEPAPISVDIAVIGLLQKWAAFGSSSHKLLAFPQTAPTSCFHACRPTSTRSPQTDPPSLLKILKTCRFQLFKQGLFVSVRFTGGSNFSLPNLPSNVTLPSYQSAEVDSDLYKSGRTGNFSYSLPVGLPGNYLVDLHFADPVASGKQLRLTPNRSSVSNQASVGS